jgi:hypothetical protein
MNTRLPILILLLSLISCDISSSEIFLLEQESILGIWTGEVETPVPNHPGTFTKNDVTITIKDKESPLYNYGDTLEIWIQEEMTSNTMVVTHQGYLTGLEEQYEPTLKYKFIKKHVGTTSNYPIDITQIHNDSIKVRFSTYEYRVGK